MYVIYLFTYLLSYLSLFFRERNGEAERQRKTWIGCLPYIPTHILTWDWTQNLRSVPWAFPGTRQFSNQLEPHQPVQEIFLKLSRNRKQRVAHKSESEWIQNHLYTRNWNINKKYLQISVENFFPKWHFTQQKLLNIKEDKSKGNFHRSKASKHTSFLKEAIQGCVQSSNFSLFTHPIKKEIQKQLLSNILRASCFFQQLWVSEIHSRSPSLLVPGTWTAPLGHCSLLPHSSGIINLPWDRQAGSLHLEIILTIEDQRGLLLTKVRVWWGPVGFPKKQTSSVNCMVLCDSNALGSGCGLAGVPEVEGSDTLSGAAQRTWSQENPAWGTQLPPTSRGSLI